MNLSLSEKMSLLAEKSNQRAKYAAIIINRNKVIGIGYNYVGMFTTHTNQCLLRALQT